MNTQDPVTRARELLATATARGWDNLPREALIRELCEEITNLRIQGEDEYLDGTECAHPAWWRGNDRGLSQGFAAALKFLEGDHEHGSSHPIAEQVRAKARGLLEENERLRAENEMLKRHWPESREGTLCRGAGGWFFRGAVLGVKPTKAEAVDMAIGYLSASSDPGHPVKPPEDPAEAALHARERERQEAAAAAIAKEDLERKRETVVRLIARWRTLPPGKPSLEGYLGFANKGQWVRFLRFGEMPAGWEPHADAFEGEQP